MAGLSAKAEGRAVQCAAECLLSLQNAEKVPETSQLKNFLEVAVASRDVRSIITWVLYQMGRKGDAGEGWRAQGKTSEGKECERFGDAVKKAIDGFLLRGLEPEQYKLSSPERLELTRIFAGQLSRLHTYLDGSRPEKNPGGAKSEKKPWKDIPDAAWVAIESLKKEAQ